MINLSNWNLCTPEADPATGLAKIYPTGELPALQNPYFTHAPADIGTPDWVRFFAPVAGETTQSTDRTRSEFRETWPDGTLRNWRIGVAAHKLTIAVTPEQAPSNGIMVLAQIHCKNADPLVKVKWKKGALFASVRETPTSTPIDTYLKDAPLGLRTSFSINLSKGGAMSVGGIPFSISGWTGADLYFKAGVYNQDSIPDTPDEAGAATFWIITPEHV